MFCRDSLFRLSISCVCASFLSAIFPVGYFSPFQSNHPLNFFIACRSGCARRPELWKLNREC